MSGQAKIGFIWILGYRSVKERWKERERERERGGEGEERGMVPFMIFFFSL